MLGALVGGMATYAMLGWLLYDVDIGKLAGIVGLGAVIGGALGARIGRGAATRQEGGDARR